MKGWVPYLSNDVTILCVDLSYGTDIPDHAQHFIDLGIRQLESIFESHVHEEGVYPW